MKKFLSLLIALAFLPSISWAAMRLGDGTTLYGEVTYSRSMDQNTEDAITWGLYSFKAQSPTTFTPLSIHTSLCANGGGTYRKGKEYFTSYYEDFTGQLGYLYFCELDLQTYEIERHALLANSYGSIGVDMTYDPVGDIIYTVSFDPNDYQLATYQLATININTGYATPIRTIARMSAIASDNMGQLWGIRYSDGYLVKIDKLTAEVTPVGPTGINPIYNGSATFDFQTGKLYWSTTRRGDELTGLYEVNTSTGSASLITLYPDNESVSALFIPQDDDITTLNPPTDVKATFNGAETDGVISLVAPTADINGNPLSGNVNISGYIDGMLNFSRPVAPGSRLEVNVTLEQGPHTLEVVATHPDAGRAQRVKVDFYVGYDGPAAVKNLTLTKIDATHAKLTWDTPEGGAHGGYVNPALVYYRIVRLPDGVVVTEEATGNEFTNTVTDAYLRTYTYEVTGIYHNVEGETAESNRVEFGQPCALPYLQTFDTMDDYKTFVVKDNNKDPNTPGYGIWGWDQGYQAARYQYHTLLPGDDYLFTPGFALSASQSYKIKFKLQTDNYYPERLEVLLGTANDIPSMTTVVMPAQDVLSFAKYTPYEFEVTVPEDGHYYFSFHALSNRGNYFILLDDVEITEGPSTASPGAVGSLAAVPGATKGSVNISFTVPSTDFKGAPLQSVSSVKVSRNDTEIATITQNVAPGATIEYTDNVATPGTVTYTVTAANEYGEGTPSETTCFAGLDVPLAPTAVSHTTLNGKEAVISWEAPTQGENGGSIAYEPISYTIVDQDNKTVATGIADTTYTHTGIDTSKGQKNMYYFVYATNSSGQSKGQGTDFITYGKPYQDSFAESFAGGRGTTTSDWMVTLVEPSPFANAFYGRYWGFEHVSTDRGPRPEPQDGDGGLLIAYTDYVNVESRMISPKINVSGLKNPVLSFWFYHYYNPDAENGYSTPNETMDVETYIDGEFQSLLAKKILLIDGNGWFRYDIPLKEAVGNKDFQIAFHTHNFLSYDMHIDNITVHDVNDHDLSLASFSVPENVSINSTRVISVTVANNGAETAEGYTVELYRDGTLFASADCEEPHPFSKERTYDFDFTPSVMDGGKAFAFSAKIVYAADENQADNASETLTLNVPASDLPGVFGLRASLDDSNIVIRWNEPEDLARGEVTEGFEQYEPFTITNFGEWTLVDNDASITYSIMNSNSETGDYDYPNAGSQMAFMILNPQAAGIKGSLWNPYLGNQMAVCFAAAERDNDDWLISPEVTGGTKVSFMARSVVDTYGLDKFYFCYSTEDTNTRSFTRIGGVNTVPAEWTLYEFELPEDARYFAINCVSSDTYALLVDEIKYTSFNPVILNLQGFNVYRDGQRLNEEIMEDNRFTDFNTAFDATYIYHVTAVYDKGESALSEALTVNPSGVTAIGTGKATILVEGHTLTISGASGNHYGIYSIGGITIFSGAVADTLTLTLEPGVYIVKDSEAGTVNRIIIQ